VHYKKTPRCIRGRSAFLDVVSTGGVVGYLFMNRWSRSCMLILPLSVFCIFCVSCFLMALVLVNICLNSVKVSA